MRLPARSVPARPLVVAFIIIKRFGKTQSGLQLVKDREAWRAAVYGSRTRLSDWTELTYSGPLTVPSRWEMRRPCAGGAARENGRRGKGRPRRGT